MLCFAGIYEKKPKLELLQIHRAPVHSKILTFTSFGANHRFTTFTLIILIARCLDHGLLELRIETTSEVVSILIG